MRTKSTTLLLAFLLAACLTGVATSGPTGNRLLFQTSTLQALLAGVYDGDLTFGELRRQGDFGLGTVEALDGEMVAVEGKFYQVKADGSVTPLSDSMKTPFAEVTFFKPDKTLSLGHSMDLKELEGYLKTVLASSNFPYALKIEGEFPYVKVRSVPRQVKPYPPLTEAVKHQAIFQFHNVKGVLVGFFHPSYLGGINVAGYHCHFITDDRQAGGHLLDCRVQRGRISICRLDRVFLRLPENREFRQVDLSGRGEKELQQVEK